jgi:hypothetical protein
MAINFSPLLQVPSVGQSFMAGQQAAQQQVEQNRLRQMQEMQMEAQRENMLAQREQRTAMAGEREAATQERASRIARQRQADEYLAKVSDLFAQNNTPLTPETAQQGLAFAIRSGDKNAIEMMSRTVQAMQEKASYEQERSRLGLGAPGATVDREQVQNMLLSTNPQIVEQGKALMGTLPKEPTPRASQLLTPEEEAQKTRIALASRPPPQPREQQPQAPVAVVDPATNRPVLVSREEALAKRMTPATAIEGLTPKERQNREAKYPQATAAVKTFEFTTDTLVKDLQRLASHPGLASITGIAAGRLPGITPAGREAEALFDKIVARGGFQELMNMRNQSPTGGALGNVSNEEGRRLQAAFAALDRRQDAPSVRKAVADAIEQLQGAKARVRDAYDLTYEYRQGSGAAPAAAAPAATKSGATVSNW